MEGKKGLHAVKKEEGKGTEKPKMEVAKWALFMSGSEFGQLVPLDADQVRAITRQVRRPGAKDEELPEELVFCNGVRDIKDEMHMAAFEMAAIAETLALAYYGVRNNKGGDGYFDHRELTALHNTADVVIEKAKRTQMLVNAFWMYLEDRRAGELPPPAEEE